MDNTWCVLYDVHLVPVQDTILIRPSHFVQYCFTVHEFVTILSATTEIKAVLWTRHSCEQSCQ